MTQTTVTLNDARIPVNLRVYAVGDVHGCFNELQALLSKIEKEIKVNPIADYKIIFLGDYFFAHAGARPNIALNNQRPDDLLWIRHDLMSYQGVFEKIIVHGHTPKSRPEVLDNRINVDTCAYDSGVLTCVILEKNSYRFIDTSEFKR